MSLDQFHFLMKKYFMKMVGIDVIILIEDNIYFMRRVDVDQREKDKINDLKTRYANSQIAGCSFGLALILSLRRYFPNNFNTLSLNRIIIQMIILSGSLFGSSISVMLGSANYLHKLKKQFVLKADPSIYKHMNQFKEKYHVDQTSQVRCLLSNQQFEEWQRIRHRDDFLKDQ